MKHGLLLALLIMSMLATGLPARASASAASARYVLMQRLIRAAAGIDHGASDAGQGQPAGRATRQIGELNLPGGLNADVWAHGNFAYVGTWSGPCPGTGVKIIDVSDAAQPHQVATAAGYPNTSAEDMQVISVHTAFFNGDLLGVGLQTCGLPDQPPGLTGLDLWDVTDPTHPMHLGFYDVGPSDGVHELSLTKRTIDGQERVFALAAVPFAEVISTAFTDQPRGDFQLIEVTDPQHPVLTDDWGAGKDGGLPYGATFFADFGAPFDCTPPAGQAPLCRGHFAAVFDHSPTSSADGLTAYLAYWDAGAILLDMSDPSDLHLIGRTPYPAGSEGDTHSAVPNASSALLVTTDEDFSPSERKAAGEPKIVGDTWGFARIWGLADPAHPAHLSDFATPHALTNKTDAFYSAHNPEIRGNTLYLSWYSDGLRIVDISQPAAPKEIGFYRPPPTLDPTGFFIAFGAGDHPIPFVWGAHVVGDRIYLSDINFGLYIVTRTR